MQLEASYYTGFNPILPTLFRSFSIFDSIWDNGTLFGRLNLILATNLSSWLMRGGCHAILFWLVKLLLLLTILTPAITRSHHQPFIRDDVRYWVPGSLPVTLTHQLPLPIQPNRSSFRHSQFGIRRHLRYQLETVRKSKPPSFKMISNQLMPTRYCPPKPNFALYWQQHDIRMNIAYFDALTRPRKGYIIPTQQRLTVPMCEFKTILDELDPLRDLQYERLISNSLYDLVSTDRVARAHMLATDLLTGLGVTRSHAHRAEAYLADDKETDLPIVFDTGCSLSVSPFKSDFVGDLEEPDVNDMRGLSDSVKVCGMGSVEWVVRDANGNVGTIRTRAYYIPQATIRLFCPQEYIHEHKNTRAILDKPGVELIIAGGHKLFFPWNCGNNLPISHATRLD